MQGIRRILVGVDLALLDEKSGLDLTPSSQNAVEQGFWLAHQLSGQLTIIHVINEPSEQHAVFLQDLTEQTADEMQRACLHALQPLIDRAEREGIAAQALVGYGTSWLEMLRQVRDGQQDVVIVGTRARGAAERFLFGSTALKLIRNCPCPVWVTKSRPEFRDEPLNFLVADDLSDTGLAALQIAVTAANLVDARVHLLHVLEDPYSAHIALTQMPPDKQEALREKDRIWAEQQLQQHLAQTDYRTLKHGVLPSLVAGKPEFEILNFLNDHEIDLLIMGTIGRSGLMGFLVGNTAERLMQTVQCAVLAVKPPGFKSPVKLD